MKKRIRHFSKSTLSIVLSLCMLISCVSVGLIATDAARFVEERVGWNTNSLTFSGQIKSDKSGFSSDINDITMTGNGTDYYYFWAVIEKNKTVYFKFKDQWSQTLNGGTKTSTNATNNTTGISRNYWTGMAMNGADLSFTTPNSMYSQYIVVVQCWTNNWDARVDMIPYIPSTVNIHYQDEYGSYHKYLYAWQSYHGGSSYNASNAVTNYTNHVGDRELNSSYGSVPQDTRAAEGVTGYTQEWNTHNLSYYDYPSNYGVFYVKMKDNDGGSKDLTINREDVSGKSEIWVYNASNNNATIVVTDRVALRNLINNTAIVNAFNGGTNTVYTDESYATFKTAYEDAAGKFSAYATTQAEINSATTTLQSAYNILEISSTPALDSFTIDGAASKTLNIGEEATLASSTSNTDNAVTYSTVSDAISIIGTTVKALKPVSSATITATLVDGETYTKTVTVKVNTPALTLTYDPATILTGGVTTNTPTVTATGANASSSISNKAFTITSGDASGTVSNDGKVTSTSTAGTVAVQVTGTVTYNGVSYNSAAGAANITVQEPASVYFKYDQTGGTTTKGLDGTKMAYDVSLGLYYLSVDLVGGPGENWYIVVYDASERNNLSHYDQELTEELRIGNGHTLYPGDNVDHPIHLVAAVTGTYKFYFNADNNSLFVEYPHTVTFNMNGHGTALSSQVITYGGKVTKPNDPTETGYTFGGWYKESGCSNAFNFDTDTITVNTTLYAKWTALPQLDKPQIKYNNAATTPVSMDAAKGSKARITWATVSGAGSYEVFKDGASQGTTNNLYFDIERGYSYSGTYTVKAIPSNPATHRTSEVSNGIHFTFNKIQLTAPTVTSAKDWVLHNEDVTFSLSGGSTTATLGTDFKFQHTGANNTTYADVSDSSYSTGDLSNTTEIDATNIYKFKATAIETDYFTDSSETLKQIVVKPSFGVDAGSTPKFAPGSATEMDYDADQGYYFLAVSLTSTADYYFRFNQIGATAKWSGGWNGGYPNVYDVVVDGSKVGAGSNVHSWTDKASLHYSGSSKKIIIWFDYTAKQVWIEGNSTKYTVTFSQPSSEGSSIKVENSTDSPQTFYEDDTANYSITAASGYVITSVTANGVTTAVDRQTSYTGSFSVTQNTSISATIVRQYSITKNTAVGGSYTVKRGTQEVTSFIAGDQLTLTATPEVHYDFTKLEVTGGKSATIIGSPSTLDTTGANGDITITPTFTAKSYTYTTDAEYSTTGGADSTYIYPLSGAVTPSSGTATNVTGVAITAADMEGYAFYKWTTTGGSISSPSATSATFKPTENNAKATALYKKVYTVTTNTPEGGTVTVSKINPVAGENYTVTVAASDGYKFKKLTVGGTEVTSSVSNGSYTATASGDVSAISVVAEFEINTNMQLFIGGRFRVRSSEGGTTWTYSFKSGDDWGQEENIQFTYDHDTIYKVETYASPQELSASFKNAGNGAALPSWFYVYDKSNSKAWHPADSNFDLTDAVRTVNLTSNNSTHNVKFNCNSTDTPVTIYYNTNTHALTYTMPEHYNVTVLSTVGGTVTADPARAVAGTEISLTVNPNDGYTLSSITANRDDNQQGVVVANNKFSMPSSAVTVTPVFEKIPYNLLNVVAHGNVSFYSDSECQTVINTATYQQVVYVKYTAGNGYMLQSFTVSGTYASGITMDSDTVGHFTMGTSDTTVTANEVQQSDVTYYIDMHDNDMSEGSTVLVELLKSDDTPYTYSGNKVCSATLTAENRQKDSTVYAVTIPTPLDVTIIKIRVTYNNTPYPPQELNINTVTALKNNQQKEVWLEAVNESSLKQESKMKPHSEKSVAADKRRIYLAKPTSISGWTTVGIYYWGSESTASFTYKDIAHMDFLGSDDNNYYYRVDVPKGVDNFLFCGWNKESNAIGSNDKPDSQTGNIESTSATGNYYTLSFSNNSYQGNKEPDAKIADYTRYVSEIYSNIMQANVTSNISIAPTLDKASAGVKVTYASADTNQVTVTENGIVTPKASTVDNLDGYVNVTVTIYSTIGEKITTETSVHDYWTYDVKVYVHDPSKLHSFYAMSLESITYTVNIPTQNNGNDQPGYFDYDTQNNRIKASVVVTGIKGVASSSNSAIITEGDTYNINDERTRNTTNSIKYAKSSQLFVGYSAITLTGSVITKSIRRASERYGFDHWERRNQPNSTPDPVTYSTSKKIENAVETLETTQMVFDPAYTVYSAIFTSYRYVDINFTFRYDVYKPQEVIYNKETGLEATAEEIANPAIEKETKINYPYDAVYAQQEGSHETITVQVNGYEVREKVSPSNNSGTTISGDNLKIDAIKALGSYTKNNTETLLLNNNYYNYEVDDTDDNSIIIDLNTCEAYTADVTVNLTKSPKTYNVYLWNGTTWESKATSLTYQAYADVSVSGSEKVKWYAVSEDNRDTDNAPLLANDTGYRFRVKGDTYLVTEPGTISDDEFNRSEVDFSHYEIAHKEKVIGQTTQMTEYLRQNFYIADFFAPSKVFDPNTEYDDNGETKYLPYDEVKFVGGGVLYYSVTDGVPFSNAVSAGYVDGETGAVNADAIKEMLKSKIEAQYAEDNLAGVIGEEDAMKAAYGTEIPVTKNVEGGFNTGIFYRYLPMETYTRDSNGKLVQENDVYTLDKTTNVNTFRYSNTLQSYQYVYASGNENKATNDGKNMRLYSYYVYSYLTYNQDTNLPETKYEVVLSDNYADASTYWAGNQATN